MKLQDLQMKTCENKSFCQIFELEIYINFRLVYNHNISISFQNKEALGNKVLEQLTVKEIY